MSLLTGILKPVSEATNRQPASGQIKGILKSNTSQQMKPRGILKTENTPPATRAEQKKQMHGILKKESGVSSEVEGTRRGMTNMESRLDQLPRKESSLDVKTFNDNPTFGKLATDQNTGVPYSGGRFEALPQQTAIAGAMDTAAAAASKSSSGTPMDQTEADADESSSTSDPTYQNRCKNKAIVRRRQQFQRQLAGRSDLLAQSNSLPSTSFPPPPPPLLFHFHLLLIRLLLGPPFF